jgi:hypothetical protein
VKDNLYLHDIISNEIIMAIATTAFGLQPEPWSAIYPFVLLSTYRLIVCQECGFASVVDEVDTHLKTRHRNIKPEYRKDLVEKIRRIPNLLRNQNELHELPLPLHPIEPITYLASPKPDGLKCHACGHIVRRIQKIQKHCSDEHQWINPRGRGRPPPDCHDAAHELPWEEGVACQRFFPSRAGNKWFQVNSYPRRPNDSNDKIHADSFQSRVAPQKLDSISSSHLSEVMEREKKYWETVNQPRLTSKDMDSGSFATTSIWMERTQWQAIYKGVRRDILRASTRLPDRRALASDFFLGQGAQEGYPDVMSSSEAEQKISCVLGALDDVVDRCENTVRQTSRFLLCWLNSTRLQHFHERPFTLVGEKNTERKYRNVQKRLLAFVFRMYTITARVNREYIKFQLSEDLSSQLQVIWEHEVWKLFDWSKGSWPMNQRSSGIGEVMDVCSIDVPPLHEYQPLQDEAGPLNASQSKDSNDEDNEEDLHSEDEDEDEDDDINSVFGSNDIGDDNSDLMIDQAGTDRNYNSEQGSRPLDESDMAIFVEFLELLYKLCLTITTESFTEGQPSSSLLIFFSGILGFSQDCKQFLLAKQFCPHLSGLIYIQRLLLMERALPLRQYHTIGIPRRPHEGQLDQLNSIREKYMTSGTQYPLAELVSLRDFGRNIARNEPPSLLFSWSDDGEVIRYGDFQLTMEKFRQVPDYFISRAEEICDNLMFDLKPDIDLTTVKDNMVNSPSGYSFVKHHENGLDEAYLDLLYAAYASRESKFSKDGQWRWKSINSYLKQVTELKEMLAGGLYTVCGQTPRARDLFTLLCESGPSSSCSIIFWNGMMGYILRHHKSKRQMGREFYVVRFLSSRLAHVMYKYLVYIRRLAGLLRREQQIQSQPYHPERLLFSTDGNHGAPLVLHRY